MYIIHVPRTLSAYVRTYVCASVQLLTLVLIVSQRYRNYTCQTCGTGGHLARVCVYVHTYMYKYVLPSYVRTYVHTVGVCMDVCTYVVRT